MKQKTLGSRNPGRMCFRHEMGRGSASEVEKGKTGKTGRGSGRCFRMRSARQGWVLNLTLFDRGQGRCGGGRSVDGLRMSFGDAETVCPEALGLDRFPPCTVKSPIHRRHRACLAPNRQNRSVKSRLRGWRGGLLIQYRLKTPPPPSPVDSLHRGRALLSRRAGRSLSS